jgi:hypothetical protein
MSSIIRATTTSGLQVAPDNSGSLQLQTNGTTTAVTIDTSQNVGIGTASPTEKLTVLGKAKISSANPDLFAITLDATTGTNAVAMYFNNTGGNAYLGLDNSTGSRIGGSAYSFNIWHESARNILFGTNNTERMRIDSSGNVGIGTSSPQTPLQIAGGTDNANVQDYITLSRTGYPTSNFRQVIASSSGSDASQNTIVFKTSDGTNAAAERMRINGSGEVYIAGTTDRGAFNLQCNGTGVWGAGAYTNGSDARIKDDIQPITSSLEVVNKLNPVTFKYKEDWSKDQSVQTGFIAQELQETLKDEIYIDGLVNTGGEYLSVAYQNIIPLLTKAIQEQNQIINDLKARVETLEAKLG